MKLKGNIFFIGLFLLVISSIPLFYMAREVYIEWKIDSKYSIKQVYEEQGLPTTIDHQDIEVNGRHIEIKEEPTGKKASLTFWDEEAGVEAGDIVKLHLFVDNKEVTTADEIWLSNRNQSSRYFSWLDILTVNEKIAIVQRLTDDDTNMDDRTWKIIWIDEKGKVKEDTISYQSRKENPLAVRLIGYSGTDLMMMGYYSDILTVYPTFLFPLMFPFGSVIMGILLCIIALFQWRKQYKLERANDSG
ncbi:hypothetical protein ACQKNC_07360 [Lysinibacillus sp. NPDC094177]|uniref:hypothetical protein n=1 Tax=Lysinibacillus sp. NPDC094177 TaxID=3390580 RepID=UPI003CFDE104